MTTFYVRENEGYRQAAPQEILTRAQRLIAQRFRAGCPVLECPERVQEFLRLRLAPLDYEVFAILFLDVRHRLIEYVELFRGTIGHAQVHSREVIKETLARNAESVVFVHNHPSGVAEPSQADELITRKLKEALALIDVRVLDHLIVGDTVFSFASRGLL